MLKQFRKSLAKFIAPALNSMSLPSQFLRYGNRKPMLPDWTEVVMSDEDFYTGYSYAAITKRANKVAQIALNNVTTESKQDDFEHPYLGIINKSSSFSDYEFWRDLSIYTDLEGVFYLLAVRNFDGDRYGDIQYFKILNPYNVRRILDPETLEVKGYVETRMGYIREIPKELIISKRDLNPFDENRTYSITDGAKENQFTLKTSKDFTRHALKHNINAPGVLTTDVILEEPEFVNFTERVKNHTKGEPIFGNGKGAITWESMAMDIPKAMPEIADSNRDELFAVFGMSKTMMGIEESGTTRDTSRVQREIFIEDQIIPRIQMILDALNQDYIDHYPQEYARTGAEMSVDNPMAVDHEADIKDTEAKQKQADLYDSLLKAGYDPDLVAQYVDGKIGVDKLGIPDRPAVPAQLLGAGDDSGSEENHLHVKKNAVEDENLSGIITQQQGALENAIVNIDQELTAIAITRVEKATNAFEEESDVITPTEKKAKINELEAVLVAFYGIVMSLRGGEVMRSRMGEFGLAGTFTLDAAVKRYIKDVSKKVATSHINTVSNDIYKTAREVALTGADQREIVNAIKEKYAQVISETRAKTISRTETNRAFTRAQYDADREFIKQNKLGKRAYKRWVTRSGNPCEFCQSLSDEGLIPFSQDFRGLGSSITVDGKTLDIDFEALQAGNAHPNCSCIYELVILDE